MLFFNLAETNAMQSEEVATAWLNHEAVRKAIHAKPVNISLFLFLSYKFHFAN